MEIVPVNTIIRKDSMISRCKICFEEESAEFGELISPCACDGSIKYVHRPCLNLWRFNNINPISKTNCEICKRPYLIKKAFKSETCNFNVYNTSPLLMIGYCFLYNVMALLFGFIFYIADKETNYFSLNILTFSSVKNDNLILILNKNNDSTWLVFYYTFAVYIASILFHVLIVIIPLLSVKRKKIYIKQMYYKFLITFYISMHSKWLYSICLMDNNINTVYMYIFLDSMLSILLNFPLKILYLYLHDLTIKKINQKYNQNIVMNCNYNPLYEGKIEEDIENKVTTENIVIQNRFVIFEPRADLEIVAENSPRRRRIQRPQSPPPPPPPPYPPGFSP